MHFDIIIVGGRVAGATLGLHLARLGCSILIVDRADFPSIPQVPSSPSIHQGTMKLLDELGVDEALYGEQKVHEVTFTVEGGFAHTFALPSEHGRNYYYGVKRDHFDHVLWELLGRYSNVTRKTGFTVTGVEGGITGRSRDGSIESFTAPWVVGADGRFSTVARLVGAPVTVDQNTQVSTVYYAGWRGWQGPPRFQIITDGRGSGVLMIPGPDKTMSVNTHMRAGLVDSSVNVQEFYSRTVLGFSTARKILEGAQQVDAVSGMKRIANRYRRAGGPGWLLVGDAWHHKDPVDGQGICLALMEAKILAAVLQEKPSDVVGEYERRATAATRPMFDTTMERLSRELYTDLRR